ncbi:hypothetical protein Cgig2_023379 [Carnegiea gigantea]|uniref:BHLH domain-containing protein n=1 Tax=Carnegiea gigantea TaxID=171969 RepID=A0A9Q1GRB4_9CARY|nr:hypothetical protein Cgig2_023379 [Carnegiea gigantea]
MLAFSPFVPSNLDWESNLVSIPSNPPNFDDDNNNSNRNSNSNKTLNSNYDLGLTFPPLFQALEGDNLDFQISKFHEAQYHKLQPADCGGLGLGSGLEETKLAQWISSSSTDHEKGRHEYSDLAKKLNHNTRERDRRKRMNALYSALRALLPASLHHKEELSIPGTISLVVDYVRELQKEVQNLLHQKEELSSKISEFQGVRKKSIPQEEKVTRGKRALSSCEISVEKLGETEIVIHISRYERVSLPEVLLLLEDHGLLVLNVSCFQCFGGRTLCSIHLWIEGAYSAVNCETLNEQLLAMFEKEAQANLSEPSLLYNEQHKSDPTTLSPYPVPWIYQQEWVGFHVKGDAGQAHQNLGS